MSEMKATKADVEAAKAHATMRSTVYMLGRAVRVDSKIDPDKYESYLAGLLAERAKDNADMTVAYMKGVEDTRDKYQDLLRSVRVYQIECETVAMPDAKTKKLTDEVLWLMREKHSASEMWEKESIDSRAPAHSDDKAVDRFAAKMKGKLRKSREKGRSGWDDPAQCTVESLSEHLYAHVSKGDPVDVANFCMMLSERESGIKAPAQDERVAKLVDLAQKMTEGMTVFLNYYQKIYFPEERQVLAETKELLRQFDKGAK